jgi:catechol 2,3-dioxygenase-like lactoylglutathione lyase family enzyme
MTELVVLQEFEPLAAGDSFAEPVRFHLSLNVSNLGEAIAFYRVLFNQPPDKQHRDYAKFDVAEPPVVFSLVPRPPGPGGSLSHLGLRVADRGLLEVFRTRLQSAGICTSNQDGTVCGYARQDKLWIRDPDGNFWEIYHIDEDVPPESVRQSLSGAAARTAPFERAGAHPVTTESQPASQVWEHYITTPFPDRIPADDGSLNEVLLTGTFNANVEEQSLISIIQEAFRALKPGGRLSTHGLMGNSSFKGPLALPGLAALVQKVPNYEDVLQQLRREGFLNIEITKLTDQPWFEVEGVALREVKIVGFRSLGIQDAVEHTVLYRGPFSRLRTDDGSTFSRGIRQQVTTDVWNALRQGSAADSFVFFEAGQADSCSTSSYSMR